MFNKSRNDTSRDRVEFFLGYQYLQHNRIYPVLEKVFGLSSCEVKKHYRTDDGITIVCRPSQFARFMILRNEAGLQNGFKDLHPKLFVPEPEKDIYTKIAEIADVDRCDVKKVAIALAYSGGDLVARLNEGYHRIGKPKVFDVSKNRYQPD